MDTKLSNSYPGGHMIQSPQRSQSVAAILWVLFAFRGEITHAGHRSITIIMVKKSHEYMNKLYISLLP